MCSAVAFSRLFLLLCLSGAVLGSAIPMWEFLSRDEKMNLLHKMFVKQVQDHCREYPMPDCEQILLIYGLTNLEDMEEDSLDKMDPYQRGATDIIWDSMMKGSSMTTGSFTQKEDINSPKENLYETNSNSGNYLGSQEEASSEVHRYIPYDTRPHLGPMMIRVLPNGDPVPGETDIPRIKDEDAEEFKLMHTKPHISVEELANRSSLHVSSPHTSDGKLHHGTHHEQPIVTAT